jgi:hypothetical protein
LGRVAEKDFGSEAADLDVSAADGIKESSVGRGAKSARDIGSEGGVVKIRDRGGGGLIEKAVI